MCMEYTDYSHDGGYLGGYRLNEKRGEQEKRAGSALQGGVQSARGRSR
jgi:hypothetical protein